MRHCDTFLSVSFVSASFVSASVVSVSFVSACVVHSRDMVVVVVTCVDGVAQ